MIAPSFVDQSCFFGCQRVRTSSAAIHETEKRYAVGGHRCHVKRCSGLPKAKFDEEFYKENLEKFVKVADEKFKVVSKIAREKSVVLRSTFAQKAEETAKQLLLQSKVAAKQMRKESERAKDVFLVKAEEVAVQAAEIAKDELERASENAPEGIKELADTAIEAHSEEKAKSGAVMHDFCLGIPFGALLAAGGLLWFFFTGSIHALRFGTLLGGFLLAVSVQSLRMWQAGKSTTRYIVTQAVVCLVLAVREFYRFSSTNRIFPSFFTALFSSAMFAFFCYVIGAGGPPVKKVKSLDPETA